MINRIGGLRRRTGDGGFTLIELLVVIIILGVLSAVVVFAVRGTGDKGRAASYATDAKTVRTAEEAFCAKNGRYGTEQELVDQKFLSEKSSLHAITLSSGGTCSGAGDVNKTKFSISCNVAEEGCGAGGATALGGTLVVGETFGSNATTNVASSTSGGTHAWWETMYNGLIELDEAGNPSPELASVVPTVANGGITNSGATYTLTLRENVKWHDSTTGTPHYFNADDVKFTFEKVLLKYHARTRGMAAALGYNSTTCRANNIVATNGLGNGGGTVVFNFGTAFTPPTPYIPFLKQLNVTEAAMNPANSIPGFTVGVDGCPAQADADKVKVGTGPFKFDSINVPSAGDGKVVKNPDYWKPGLPYLDGILMRPYTTDGPRYSALTNGDVDFVWDVPNPNVAALNANPAFDTAATQSLGGGPNSVDQVIFNLKASGSTVASVADGTAPNHPILGDVRVRKAIFHAINRDDFLNIGRNGIGTVSKSPISSQIFGAATDIPLPAFDTTAANALLDAAGWNGTPRVTVNSTPNTRVSQGVPGLTDGTPLTIRFLQGSPIFTDRVAVIKSNLAAVGIDMPVTTNFATTGTTATAQVFNDRNFDLYIVNYANGYDPHVGVRRQYHTDQISTSGTPNNAAGYRNAAVSTAFDDAAKTLDTTARYNLYHDIQQQVVTDLPYAWMIETPNVRGFTAQCTGFKVWTGLFAESASCHR